MIPAFYPSSILLLGAGQLARETYSRLMHLSLVPVKAVRNQMIPQSAEWRREMVNPFDCCSSLASLPVWPHCMNAIWIRCHEDLTASPWRTGDHQDTHVLHGWILSSKTWNPKTSLWKKHTLWLRIVHSGDWCLRFVLNTSGDACMKWMSCVHHRQTSSATVACSSCFDGQCVSVWYHWLCVWSDRRGDQ